MMKKRLKRLRCGRMVYMVCYTAPQMGDSVRARAEKLHASTAARERLNARTSIDKLERTLADNFDDGDILLTLTFEDRYLPENRDQAIQRARVFFKGLRTARKARGEKLIYLYEPEGLYPGGRIHLHVVINSTGQDIDEIRKIWTYGKDVDIRRLVFNREFTYRDLALYLTKEPRKWGHPKIGERMWIPSLGLTRSEPVTEDVPDYLTLTAPPEAVDVYYEPPVRNGWGEYSYIRYMLPYVSKRKRSKRRRSKKPKE